MPKRYIAYLFGLVLLVAAGLYGYYKWQKAQNKVNLWTLVPDDAVFVAETNRNNHFIRQLKKTEIYESLARLPFFTGLQENLSYLDSAATRRVTLREFLDQKKIVTSLHVTSKVDFSLVMYVPISTVAEHRYVRNVIENVSKSTLFASEEQDYQNYTITSVHNQKSNGTFYFFTYRNNIILSPEVSLLHQVIRKINRTNLQSPVQEYEKQSFLKKSTVYDTLFINYRHLPPFLALFLKPAVYPEVEFLASLCRSSLLGLQLDNQNFYLNGVSQPETLAGSLYEQFKTLRPPTTRMASLIPERTALLIHFGEAQFTHWLSTQKNAALPVAPEIAPALDSLRGNFKQELAINYLAAATQNTAPDKIVLAYTPQPNKIRTIVQEINQVLGTSFSAKRAGRYQIQEVGVPELPQQLFGRGFSGFARCYVAQVDSFMLFAASEEALRGYLQNIRDKKVLTHSTAYKTFRQSGLTHTNVSLYVNTNLAWNILSQNLVEDKKVGLLRYERIIKKFGQISLQFGHQDKQFITRFLLQHQPETSSPLKLKEVFKQEQEIAFAAPLISGPSFFPILGTSGSPVLIQDSALVLHQVTEDGKIAWSDSLDSKITSTIYPVQLGSNSQPKYIFSTKNRIYCLDQGGYDVENFPFNLSDTTQIQNLTVINRGPAQSLHFLVTDTQNNVYLYDQQGSLLPGWEPKEMPGKLALAPYYLQIKGREVFVIVLENGYVYAMDLNGANYPGFPINLKGNLTAPLIAQPGASFQNTNLLLLTQAGELITFNLAGQVKKRMAFARPSRRTTFNLVLENSGKSFLVARQDLGRVTLYDAEQKLVMEKNYVTSAPKLIQFFYFDPANIIYAITERGPQKTYLYDINIKLLGVGPLTNKWPVQMAFNSLLQQYQIYLIQDNVLQQFSFRTQP
ncbi:hypothetical protein [Adhaeribacter pallidiroseus]|uniref:Uncharacterized protein n=1 Tax=Adhaeribacter pallidiroseus TaxID=2072847 RepID=A0A369QL26_9BACT|nr:hypothetical protein [Adhaeribacter pallidiroseus]RDC63539.1 hypothetical protein AHMF7616_02144 [Adhaeribacter pallidiroseus]